MEAQIVLNPSAPGVIGVRNLDDVVDDIRIQIADGSRRGPDLQRLLQQSGVDPLRSLPLPHVALGLQGMETSTTILSAATIKARPTSTEFTLTTAWPQIPTSAMPTGPSPVRAAVASGKRAQHTPMRMLLTTTSTAVTLPVMTTLLREGLMNLPEDAYKIREVRPNSMHLERLSSGINLECSGGLCKGIGGDGGALIVPSK